MFKTLKSSLIVGGILVALIVVVVVGLQRYSERLHYNPGATLAFATSAKTMHDKLDPDLLSNITVLADRITADASVNASEMQLALTQGALAANSYLNQFGYIQPTSDTLDLYTALQQEASFIGTSYAKLNAAWSARQEGDLTLSNTNLKAALASRDQAVSLRQQNTAALDNLITTTQAKLAK